MSAYTWVSRGPRSGVVRGADGVQRQVAWRSAPDGEVEVWIDGVIERVAPAVRRKGGKGGAGLNQNSVVASMPGVVLQLRAEVGESVEAGQVLVVMESMKMELTLEAPRAGKIKAVRCQSGQMVELGAALVELE